MCALCLVRQVPKGFVKHCSRGCTVRAADLRRRGLEPVERGYAAGTPQAGRLLDIVHRVQRMRDQARRARRWDEAQALEAARCSLLRADMIRQARKLERASS